MRLSLPLWIEQPDRLSTPQAIRLVFAELARAPGPPDFVQPNGKLSAVDPDISPSVALMRRAPVNPGAEHGDWHAEFVTHLAQCVEHRQQARRFYDGRVWNFSCVLPQRFRAHDTFANSPHWNSLPGGDIIQSCCANHLPRSSLHQARPHPLWRTLY